MVFKVGAHMAQWSFDVVCCVLRQGLVTLYIVSGHPAKIGSRPLLQWTGKSMTHPFITMETGLMRPHDIEKDLTF